MRHILTGLLLLTSSVCRADDAPKDVAGALKIGGDLPGSFLPFNATGPFKGRFHCLVSDYGLEPTVIVFIHGVETTDGLNDLLKQIDARISQNPAARLHACAVFLVDSKIDLVADNDMREQLARKVEDIGSGLMLKNIVLGLDTPKGVAKYGIGEQWGLAVLGNKYRVVAVHSLAKGDEKVDQIIADIAEKLKANKKK